MALYLLLEVELIELKHGIHEDRPDRGPKW
jgi:hypothetical protein